jgi:serine/threonine protein kinase
MAPERFLGEAAEARTVQFSFSVTLYEALYGQRPFAGRTVDDLSKEVLAQRVRVPPQGSIPTQLWHVVSKGLARDPENRHRSVNTLLEALGRASVPRRRWSTWSIAACMAAAAIGAVWFDRGRLAPKSLSLPPAALISSMPAAAASKAPAPRTSSPADVPPVQEKKDVPPAPEHAHATPARRLKVNKASPLHPKPANPAGKIPRKPYDDEPLRPDVLFPAK